MWCDGYGSKKVFQTVGMISYCVEIKSCDPYGASYGYLPIDQVPPWNTDLSHIYITRTYRLDHALYA